MLAGYVFLWLCCAAAGAEAQETEFAVVPGYAADAPVEDPAGSHTFWINDKKTPVQGETYRYTYHHEASGELLPSFRIIAYFGEMVKNRGGTILYENPRNFLHARLSADGSDYWIEVFAETGGEEFSMVLVRQPKATATETAELAAEATAAPVSRGVAKPVTSVKLASVNPSLRPCPRPPKGSRPFSVSFAGKALGPKFPSDAPDISFLKAYQPGPAVPLGTLDAFSVDGPNCRY
ncbi:hypothetical protein [Geomesophilobacter sediminis]|uniref:Uncharacterized protein n=1 Tax=Geomesophilobacter sediminis TaxID=2798584 RepID=A0A8J7S9Z0_9BACT|nr:hypothetical protein [Geomesophilobacter sediminis]MBJ6727150.1 hypothetical protein [Geomesophilobacter sediminis]